MSKIQATVRVRPDEHGVSRPSRERVHYVARQLEASGLEVFHEGRFGVSVRAEPEQFLEALGLKVPPEQPSAVLKIKDEQLEPRLRGLVDLLEIASRPQFLSDLSCLPAGSQSR